MKRANSSVLAFFAFGCLGYLLLAGCVDGKGLATGRSDAGAGGALAQGGAGQGGMAGSKGAGGVTSDGGAVASGGDAGTKGSGGVTSNGGAVASGGDAGIKGSGGVTSDGGAVASGGNAGTKGSGGSAGTVSGGTVGTGGVSETGGKGSGGSKDAGIDVVSPDVKTTLDSSPRDTIVVCGPVCDIYCAYGNVLDANGCPTCKCNPAPTECPVIKCKACTYGYLLDDKGCQTCDCAPDPGLPCGQRTNSTTCAGSDKCRWLEPGCGTPALATAGCYETATIDCTPDSVCADGKTCLKRVINPCYNLACNACGQTINICL